MTKKKAAYLVMLAAIGLLVYNLVELDMDKLNLGSLSGPISNVLLILAMVFSIREMNKNSKKKA